MTITDTLALTPPVRRMAILVRHAERGPIVDISRGGLDVLLTDGGKQAAERLGRGLRRPAAREVWHSPVERCRQTAERIAAGWSEDGVAVTMQGEMDSLGGPYLRSVRPILELARDLGDDFLRHWFGGRLSPELIEDPATAARTQIEPLRQAVLRPGEGASVMVSHDWNVMLVREVLLGVRHEDVGWADFLDGVVAYPWGGEVVLRYGEIARPI